jgi:biopolymer transport protein ExbD
MKRFSQRSHLVTLSEINVTPLLDLAFVLLIIFVITTPLLEQGMSIKLPGGGKPDTTLVKSDIRTVEIDTSGNMMFDRRRMSLNDIEKALIAANRANPKTVVHIRADQNGKNKDLFAVIERCQRNGITRFSLRTETPTTSR